MQDILIYLYDHELEAIIQRAKAATASGEFEHMKVHTAQAAAAVVAASAELTIRGVPGYAANVPGSFEG